MLNLVKSFSLYIAVSISFDFSIIRVSSMSSGAPLPAEKSIFLVYILFSSILVLV